jgi:hypothetical protein
LVTEEEAASFDFARGDGSFGDWERAEVGMMGGGKSSGGGNPKGEVVDVGVVPGEGVVVDVADNPPKSNGGGR